MNYLCSVISHFNYFLIAKLFYPFCFFVKFGVSIHYTLNIFPYCLALCRQQISKYSGSIIASFTAKRGAFIFICGANKALCNYKIIVFEKRSNSILHSCVRKIPVYFGIAKIIIGTKDIP